MLLETAFHLNSFGTVLVIEFAFRLHIPIIDPNIPKRADIHDLG